MKKATLSMLAIVFAATTIMAHTPATAKKAKVKQATCTSCPKGQKCAKSTCADPAGCCK